MMKDNSIYKYSPEQRIYKYHDMLRIEEENRKKELERLKKESKL